MNKNNSFSAREFWDLHNPFPQKGFTVGSNIFNIVFLSITLPMLCVSIITECIYCLLDIIIPNNTMPRDLQRAYEAK